jgi:hypothetical protein
MKSLTKPIAAFLIAGLCLFAGQVMASPTLPSSHAIKEKKGSAETNASFSISINQIYNSDRVRLLIYKPGSRRLFVKLKDNNRATIHSFLTGKKEQTIGKDYNFSGADDGVYTLQVSDGKSVISKRIMLKHIKIQEATKINIE